MLNTIVRRNSKILAIILVLSLLLAATTVLAATKLIKAGKGGTIRIANGISIKIEKNSLQENTLISAKMVWGNKYIDFHFEPDDTVFSKPAKLKISLNAIDEMDLETLVLYGKNGEQIEPARKKRHMEYKISHFSIYYYRRR